MNPEQLLQYIQEALQKGVSPAEIEAKLPEVTGGQFKTIKEVEENKALLALNATGGGKWTGAGKDFLHEAAQGTTFGFSDELRGLGAALVPGGDTYAEARDKERARLGIHEELNPGSSMAAQIAGGAPLTLLGSVAGARTAVGGSKVAGGLLGGAATGAAGGAAYGAGTGETGRERAIDAAIGGVLGGTIGGVVGGGTALVSRFLKGGDPGARAAAVLRRALKKEGLRPEEIDAALLKLGDGSVVADLSPNLTAEADAAVVQANSLRRAGGPVDKLRGRGVGRGERVVEYLREASGQPSYEASLAEAESALRQVRKEAYKPLEKAFKEVDGENVQEALRNSRIVAATKGVDPKITPRNAEASIQDLMDQWGVDPLRAQEMIDAGKISVSPGPVGAETSRLPSITELQDILGALRDAAKKAGKAGRPDAYLKAQEAAQTLRDAMSRDIPGFDEAQALFGPVEEALDSHDLGRSLANGAIRDIKAALAKLRGPGKETFRLGLRAGLEDSMLKAGEQGGSTTNKLMQAANSPEHWGELVKIIAPDKGAREKLLADLARERIQKATEQGVGQGSQTAGRELTAAAQQALPYPSKHGILHRAMQRTFLGNQETRGAASEIVGNALLAPNASPLMRVLLQRAGSSPAAGAGGLTGAVGGAGGSRLLRGGGR